jgi:anti-sigma factor RsiW
MECSEPGAISDEELMSCVVGDKVRSEVTQHLALCQSCSSQVAAFQRFDLQLTTKLYRWDCPPTQELGDYQLGLLASVQSRVVQSHLLSCLRCTAELASLTNFLANDPMLAAPIPVISSGANHRQSVQAVLRSLDQWREQTVEGARRIVATLLPAQPRLAFQRDLASQLSSWPRNYAAEDVSISVQLERSPNRGDALQIIGFVKRSGRTLEALEGTPVHLLSENGSAFSQSIDELGNFVFPSVAPASYSLEVLFPESVVLIEDLPIGPQD